MMVTTDSSVESFSYLLEGAFLHAMDDPEGSLLTLRHFASRNQETVSTEHSLMHFAGRTYPVVDFGEASAQQLQVGALIEHGPDYQDTLTALRNFVTDKRVLCYRDSRGRSIIGVPNNLQVRDVAHGSQVGFTIRRVDFDENLGA